MNSVCFRTVIWNLEVCSRTDVMKYINWDKKFIFQIEFIEKENNCNSFLWENKKLFDNLVFPTAKKKEIIVYRTCVYGKK